MITLSKSLLAWASGDFRTALKNEIKQLKVDELPLQQGLEHSSHAIYDDPDVIILSVSEEGNNIRVKAGVFYSGIISGCSCADDPTPTDMVPEHCELQLDINKETGNTSVSLLQN